MLEVVGLPSSSQRERGADGGDVENEEERRAMVEYVMRRMTDDLYVELVDGLCTRVQPDEEESMTG